MQVSIGDEGNPHNSGLPDEADEHGSLLGDDSGGGNGTHTILTADVASSVRSGLRVLESDCAITESVAAKEGSRPMESVGIAGADRMTAVGGSIIGMDAVGNENRDSEQ